MLFLPALARPRPVPSAAFSSDRSCFERGGFRFLPSGFALALLTAVLLASGARADIHTTKQKGNIPRDIVAHAPATAIPNTGEIDPGGQIKFTLEGRGAGTKTVDFDFSVQPQHGILTGFRYLTRNTAEVTYEHNPDSGPGVDEFSYRVHASDLEMSAPARVAITIHEYPPQLSVSPAELDFGAVDSGQSARAQVSVRNDGGGLAVGRLDLPEPWVVEGDATYRLPAGQKQTFRVVFQPVNGRSFSETVRVGDFNGGNQHFASLHLIGTGLGGPVEKQFAGINGVAPAPFEDIGSSVPSSARAVTAARYPAGTPVTAAAGSAKGTAASVTGTAGRAGSAADGGAAGVDSAGRASAGPAGGDAGSASGGTSAGGSFEAPVIVLNEASVKKVEILGYGRTYMNISWQEPKPRPARYRVELRRLTLDTDDQLLVTWLPHEKVDFRVKDGAMTALLRDLPAGTSQTVRVVAVDSGGRLATPSPIVQAMLDPALHWWKLSFLQWLLIACAVCVGFVVRQRMQDRQIIAQIDLDRSERHRAEAMSVHG